MDWVSDPPAERFSYARHRPQVKKENKLGPIPDDPVFGGDRWQLDRLFPYSWGVPFHGAQSARAGSGVPGNSAGVYPGDDFAGKGEDRLRESRRKGRSTSVPEKQVAHIKGMYEKDLEFTMNWYDISRSELDQVLAEGDQMGWTRN